MGHIFAFAAAQELRDIIQNPGSSGFVHRCIYEHKGRYLDIKPAGRRALVFRDLENQGGAGMSKREGAMTDICFSLSFFFRCFFLDHICFILTVFDDTSCAYVPTYDANFFVLFSFFQEETGASVICMYVPGVCKNFCNISPVHTRSCPHVTLPR